MEANTYVSERVAIGKALIALYASGVVLRELDMVCTSVVTREVAIAEGAVGHVGVDEIGVESGRHFG